MTLSTIFYLTQLGFCQYDISNMIDMKHITVEGAINRVATTGYWHNFNRKEYG